MADNPYCYTPDEMTAFVEGTADPERRAAFERHILKCAQCRREWIDISLARTLTPEQPPRHIQDAMKAAPFNARRARRAMVKRHALAVRRRSLGVAVASVAAAVLLVAVVLVLVTPQSSVEPTGVPGESADNAGQKPSGSEIEKREVELVEGPDQDREEIEKKVESLPLPEPKPEVKLAGQSEPVRQEKTVNVEPEVPEKDTDVELAEREELAEAEKLAEKPEPGPDTQAEKKEELPAPPAAGEKLALKLNDDDAEIFRKLYKSALLSVISKEQELIKAAQQQAKKFDPILGRPPTGLPPVTPPKQQPEQPKEQPKQDPAKNPNAPPPLPRIDELRKKGKLPPEKKEEPPQEQPKEEPKPDPAPEPKQDPAGPKDNPAAPPVVPRNPKPAGPGKKGLVQLPEVSPEELQKLAEKAGFKPRPVPGLKDEVLLAHVELAEDSKGRKVAHLFYYVGKSGFSIFERKTERTDEKNSYQVHYNGKGKTRTLMWATGGREYVLLSQKLSKRQMCAIENSIRELTK